jgi:hydrogenase maturation protease
MARVTLLVCGEAMRGDDALALRAVAALPAEVSALAEIREIGQLSPDELLDAPAPVIVVDAVSGPPPGELVDMALGDVARMGDGAPHAASTHALPLATAIGLSIRLRGSAPEGRFLGMAGAEYGIDLPLSPVVADALPRLTDAIARWIRDLSRPAALTGGAASEGALT